MAEIPKDKQVRIGDQEMKEFEAFQKYKAMKKQVDKKENQKKRYEKYWDHVSVCTYQSSDSECKCNKEIKWGGKVATSGKRDIYAAWSKQRSTIKPLEG